MNFHLFPARIILSIDIIGYSFYIISTLFPVICRFSTIYIHVTRCSSGSNIFFLWEYSNGSKLVRFMLYGIKSVWKWYLWTVWGIKHSNTWSRCFPGGRIYKDLSTDFIIKSKSFTTLTHNQWVISAFARLPSHGLKWFLTLNVTAVGIETCVCVCVYTSFSLSLLLIPIIVKVIISSANIIHIINTWTNKARTKPLIFVSMMPH